MILGCFLIRPLVVPGKMSDIESKTYGPLNLHVLADDAFSILRSPSKLPLPLCSGSLLSRLATSVSSNFVLYH